MNIGDILYDGRETGHSTTDPIVRQIIYARCNVLCQICKRAHTDNPKLISRYKERYFGPNYHIDHIVPYSRGGKNHIDNYQLLCGHCNRTKSNKIGEEQNG